MLGPVDALFIQPGLDLGISGIAAAVLPKIPLPQLVAQVAALIEVD